MKRRGRRGFFLVWTELAICILLVLGGAVLTGVTAAVSYWGRAAEAADRLLIAQEAMEMMKYNARFRQHLALPERVERNGRYYRIRTARTTRMQDGLWMEEAVCVVESPSGEQTEFRTFTGPAEAGE